jgi:hypothetical protein
MKFRDYYKVTLPTFKFCLKICGVIFTAIAAIIAIGVALKEEMTESPFLIFLACVVYGNLLGLFISVVGLFSGFYNAKRIFQVASYIPQEIRSSLSMEINQVIEDYRYHFLSFAISGFYDGSEIRITYHQPMMEVWIHLQLDPCEYEQINRKMSSLNKRYRKQNIQLTGLGLGKAFKYRTWKRQGSVNIMEAVQELFEVSEREKLKKLATTLYKNA